jgi:hypothetical protein
MPSFLEACTAGYAQLPRLVRTCGHVASRDRRFHIHRSCHVTKKQIWS